MGVSIMIRSLATLLRSAMFAIAAIAILVAPAAAQKKGGTFIIASEGEPSVLTAHLSTDTSAVLCEVLIEAERLAAQGCGARTFTPGDPLVGPSGIQPRALPR